MEADRSFHHFCKLCNKSFRCGRSLGGHTRSHLMNTEPQIDEKSSMAKLRGLNNGGNNSSQMNITVPSTCSGYGLRENPKRNSKHGNRDSEISIPGKFCRECGKAFQSWKALFGHMKSHLGKAKSKAAIKMEDQEESWCFMDQKLVNDSQSDNEFSKTPNRKKRSRRRRIRQLKTETSSSFSIANASSSSASEIDQEQEEIALCLIMLSRDLGHWGEIFSEIPRFDRNNFARSEFDSGKMDSGDREKLKNKSEHEIRFGITNSATKLGKNIINEDPKTPKIHPRDSENDKISHKRSKFECSSCRKVFNSYQALGGHKACHRKMKSCFDSTMALAENSGEGENDNQIDSEINVSKKTRKTHECPICFKQFSSGQALGGHKRSHLFGFSANSNNQSISEARDFIDLNLPAPADEEINTSGDNLVVDPWWGKSFYENEKLLSLTSLAHSHGF